uniref:Uncharacterized protein n=1 Tax=Oryza barthii TaxID=65489 RepID=A0A0D3ELS9_9ORYZ
NKLRDLRCTFSFCRPNSQNEVPKSSNPRPLGHLLAFPLARTRGAARRRHRTEAEARARRRTDAVEASPSAGCRRRSLARSAISPCSPRAHRRVVLIRFNRLPEEPGGVEIGNP